MVKGTALFGHPEDPDAFEEYYANTHVPLVQKIPNLLRFEPARIVATPAGSEPSYYRIGELYFEDMRADAGQPVFGRRAGGGRKYAELRDRWGDDAYIGPRRISNSWQRPVMRWTGAPTRE